MNPALLSSGVVLILSALFALLPVVLLSDDWILRLYIVFGQAHFLLAYLYTKKAGKFNRTYVAKFLFLLIVVGLTSFIIPRNDLYFITIAGLIFVFHYINDEFKLGALGSLRNKLLLTTAVALAFTSLFLVKMFSSSVGLVYVMGVGALFFAALFAREMVVQKAITRQNAAPLLFFLLNIAAPVYLVFNENISVIQVLGFIILFHYIRWYIYYLQKFKGAELAFYLRAVALCNIFVLLVALEYMFAGYSGLLYVFFDPNFFYGWTVIHVFLSVRREDYTLTG